MTATDQLREILDRRIGVLDGSWGVLIHRRRLSEAEYRGEPLREHGRDVKGDPDLLNLTRPELIAEIHDAYFAAGADIATTNTFTATSIGQGDYDLGHLAAEMSGEGARLARAAAEARSGLGHDRSLSPIPKYLRPETGAAAHTGAEMQPAQPPERKLPGGA